MHTFVNAVVPLTFALQIITKHDFYVSHKHFSFFQGIAGCRRAAVVMILVSLSESGHSTERQTSNLKAFSYPDYTLGK